MRTIHFSDASDKLEAIVDLVNEDHDAILITGRDVPNAVIMSQAQYDSWVETAYLLHHPCNANRPMRSIEQHRRGKA
ncbi:type II toxin-antitoxin system Phd/YefM family antitoxin [Cupriavidus gilardii]|uniref:type II toxin-antitoxin system Phd/YefM family antitoxin n=1 Tax=Cupriavidus gilardii TaxID=82541 RepID=UPI0021C0F077|nr:type II toxin-antitoxin system prevent-host-death family antitoxin [Cupriavidus gilardii]MCT9124543.1 type II toxin-antitoxin system prevent-host-death family antitoxin [Cupriavidus gilardii]